MDLLDFAYARARLQARHGGLPDGAVWRGLEASHTPAHYIAAARTGPLAPWLAGLADGSDVHRVEAHLRVRWQRYVAEVASWQPAAWQAATRWFGTLPELPTVDGRLGTDSAPRWLATWLRLMPRQPEAAARLRQVAALLMPRLPGATDHPGAHSRGRCAVPEAEHRALRKLFRRCGASPVAAVAHLALVALDLERLRGGIVARLLLGPPPRSAPSAEAGAEGA